MPDKKKIIIDCDPGIDDALALMLAYISEDVDIQAVTAVFGNADVDKTYENILKIFKLCRFKEVPPVGKGAANSLSGRLYKPRFVHGIDGLGNTNIEIAKRDRPAVEAASIIKQLLDKNKVDTLVSLGPLTNIAQVLIDEPAIKENIPQIILMGGAVFTSGNATEYAEFNIYQDPEAAKVVINSKIPIKLVSLDASRKILYSRKILDRIKYNKGTELSEFIKRILNFSLDYHKKYRHREAIYLPDVLAMSVLLDENLGSFKDLSVDVDIEKDIGKTFVNLGVRNNVKFLEEVNTDKAIGIFIDGINKIIG